MKQDLLSKVLIFATGATIGSLATWAVMKSKYRYACEKNEDIEETIKMEPAERLVPEQELADEQTMIQYNKLVNDSGYSGVVEQKEEDDDVEKPYMIPPEEFDELDGYKTVTLYWYENRTLVDEMENEIDDPEDIIGYDALKYFEVFNDDSLYVRNDARKTDYEILRG